VDSCIAKDLTCMRFSTTIVKISKQQLHKQLTINK
jgi:hypothetical protein